MQTSLDFLKVGQNWPPEGSRARLKLYKQNRQLFEGEHEKVFKRWVQLLRQDQKATLEMVLNWPKRLSTLWADLLLGEAPIIRSGEPDSPEQQRIQRFIDSGLIPTIYEGVIDTSRFGDGIFKIRYDGTQAIIDGQAPDFWFPVASPDNVKDIQAHVLAWTYEQNTVLFGANRKQKFLKCEIHERGKITTRIHQMNGDRIGNMVGSEEVVMTGVDDFLVVQVSNLLTTDRVIGLDDYRDLDSIIQELEMRIAQISKILDKHADPNMYGPDTAIEEDAETGEASLKGGGSYFPVGPDEEPPGYVIWDGQLEAAFKQIDTLMTQFYMLSETSAAAFGELKAGLAESGTALRRLMMTPLAKTNRIRMRFDPAIKKLLKLATELEVVNGAKDSVKLPNLTIDWNDGLPDDSAEETHIEAERYMAGLTSLESAVKRLYRLEGKNLAEELKKIKEEQKPEVIETPEVKPTEGE